MFEKLRAQVESFFDMFSKVEVKGKTFDRVLDDLRLILLENDVAFEVADHICQTLRERVESITVPRFSDMADPVKRTLKDILIEVLDSGGTVDLLGTVESKRKLNEPTVLVFVGINGTGKTTTVAKVARLLSKNRYICVVSCSDTYRTGSIEQVEEHARRIGVKTIKHQYGSDAAAVAFDAINYAKSHGVHCVLIDTAGRIQTDRNLMQEMSKIIRVAGPDLVIFVGDALAGNDAVLQALEFTKFVRVDGSILTKMDADAKGGSAISIAYATKKPIIFLGVGQGYDDLVPFDSRLLVARILG